jgi:hypothetical protein
MAPKPFGIGRGDSFPDAPINLVEIFVEPRSRIWPNVDRRREGAGINAPL